MSDKKKSEEKKAAEKPKDTPVKETSEEPESAPEEPKEDAPSEPPVEEPKEDAPAEQPADEPNEPEPEINKDVKPTTAQEQPSKETQEMPEKPREPKSAPAKEQPIKAASKEGSEKKEAEKDDDFRYIVRIANTDVDGEKRVINALTQVKGIGFHMATIIIDAAKVDRTMKMGDLPDSQIEKINKVLESLSTTTPKWMLNHRKDYDTGDDLHLISSDVDRRLRDDINQLKMIRSYRGIRHETGLPARGQRTRANGRGGLAMGVSKKREQSK